MPSKWLIDPSIADKVRGIHVQVHGTFGPTGWHNGDYEGMTGVVLTVHDTKSETIESTARVRLDQPLDVLDPILTIPVQFVAPVHPDNTGEDVIILAGLSKGSAARVEAVESNDLMVVTTKASFLVVDSAPSKLVRVVDVDEVANKR